jgi:hypothetical protein
MTNGIVRRRWSARRACAVGAALVAPAALWAPAAADAAPNPCHITGITTAVGKKVFPQLQSITGGQTEAPTTPPNFGSCDVAPKNLPTSLEVELWSAADFQTQSAQFDNGKREALPSLGKGAFYSPVKGNKNAANLLFKRGKYTVLIYPSRIGGPSSDYPTEKQYVTLAQAVSKHLG